MSITVLSAWALAFVIAGVSAWLLIAVGSLAGNLAKERNVVFGIATAFLLTPLWAAYKRLEVFDGVDSLDANQRQSVTQYAARVRGSLVRLFMVVAPLLAASYVLLIGIEQLPVIANWAWLAVPIAIMIAFLVFSKIVLTLVVIEQYRADVAELKRKEEARRRLIEKLQAARKADPLKGDPHLVRYTTPVGGGAP